MTSTIISLLSDPVWIDFVVARNLYLHSGERGKQVSSLWKEYNANSKRVNFYLRNEDPRDLTKEQKKLAQNVQEYQSLLTSYHNQGTRLVDLQTHLHSKIASLFRTELPPPTLPPSPSSN